MNQKLLELTGIEIPAEFFGENAVLHHEGGKTAVISMDQVNEIRSYQAMLEREQFQKTEEHWFGEAQFVFYRRKSDTLLLSFFPTVGQMRLVVEPSGAEYRDCPGEEKSTVLFTQIDLEDFGLSNLIRLQDGRFIVIDGGWEFEPEAEKLFRCMQEQSPDETPVIALWIMTHAHCDHYPCFFCFWERYGTQVEIQGFLYNFPDGAEELLQVMPELEQEWEGLHRFHSLVQELAVSYYRAHTGQVYRISDAVLEILSSPDDILCSDSAALNVTSLVIKITVENQVILIAGDTYFEGSKLAERYGTYLKADILQVPHHGFYGGTEKGYRLIDPDVVLIPVSEKNFFSAVSAKGIYLDINRELLYENHVKEVKTGSDGTKNVTLELPYFSPDSGRHQLFHRVEQAKKENGATSWIFMDMTWETCVFQTLNMISVPAEIDVSLYFQDPKNKVLYIRYIVPAQSIVSTNFACAEEIDADARYYNPHSLAKKGIPEGAHFAVHISSNVPVVVTGPKQPAYFY